MVKHFCTYFDRNYLSQALSLYSSLMETSREEFSFSMLCLDDESYNILSMLKLPKVDVLSEEDITSFEPQLNLAKQDRPRMEYYYCFTPTLVRYVFSAHTDAAMVAYIDADLFFFQPFDRILEIVPQGDIYIVEHLGRPGDRDISHGIYNVSMNIFRKSENSFQCLRWWSEKTLHSTKLGGETWGDQKYLDEFPGRFQGVAIISQVEIGAAPWNIIYQEVHKDQEQILINARPLIVYHFARFIMLSKRICIPVRRIKLQREALDTIYSRYIETMKISYDRIRTIDPQYKIGYTLHNLRGAILGLLMGRAFFKPSGRLRRIGISVPFGYELG